MLKIDIWWDSRNVVSFSYWTSRSLQLFNVSLREHFRNPTSLNRLQFAYRVVSSGTSHHSLSFSKAETFIASDWIPKIMVQFCYLRIYLGTVSCRLLQRIYGSRKGTIQKYFANPKKYFKSKSFFQNHCRKVWQI